MNRLNLLIVDGSEDFRLALDQHLRALYTVHHASDGEQALQICQVSSPDLIILDLMLTGMDGIYLLQEIQRRGFRPHVLVVTKMYTDYVFDAADELGVDYVMRKPCKPTVVAQRVQDLAKRSRPKQSTITDPAAYLNERITQANFSTRHRGFAYLRESVLIFYRNPGMSITKELYPAVAVKFDGVTWQQVERSIRSAISCAWTKSGETGWAELLPDIFGGITKCPSNGDVITRLAEHLQRVTDKE